MQINPRVAVMREAVGKVVDMLAMRRIKVTQQGSKAFVLSDRKTGRVERLNLPYLPDDASDALLNAVQGYLDHEVSHVLHSDLKLLSDLGLGKPKEYGFLLNVIEDTFIEREMAKRFAGSAANLEVTQQFVLDKVVAPAIAKNGPSLNVLIMPMLRAMAGQSVMRDFLKPYAGALKPITDALGPDFPALVEGIKTTADTGKVADEFVKRLKNNMPPMPDDDSAPQQSDGDEGEPSDDEGQKQSNGGGGDDDEQKEQKGQKHRKAKSKKDDAEGDAEDDKGDPDEGACDDDAKDDAGDDAQPGDEGDAQDDDEGEPDADDADADEGDGDDEKDGSGGDADAEDDDQDGAGDQDDQGDGEAGEDDQDEGEGDEFGAVDAAPRPQNLEDDSEVEAQEASDHERGEHGAPGDQNNDVLMPDEERKDLNEELKGMDEDGDYDAMAAKAIEQDVADLGRDAEYLIYTTDFDRIEPIKVPSGFGANPSCVRHLKELVERTEHMVAPMQKDLERAVAARSAAVFTAGHRSGRLHGASLARVVMQRDDVFRRKQVNKTKDVAVSLVVDCSGSMADKIETAASAAYALSMTLERLNIKNEVLAFTTDPRAMPRDDAKRMLDEARKNGRPFSRHTPIYMPIVKEFHERINPQIKERFAILSNYMSDRMQSNVDGESVMLAYRRLVVRREERKIMIVLSDGYPADMGDNMALRAHLRDTVKMIEARGVDVIGIGIRSGAVRDFYRKHVVLHDIKELPNEVLRRLKEMLLQLGN